MKITNRRGKVHAGSVTLLPGEQEVSDESWDKVKNLPGIVGLIKDGALEAEKSSAAPVIEPTIAPPDSGDDYDAFSPLKKKRGRPKKKPSNGEGQGE